MWNIYIINKNNYRRVNIIETALTEEQAESICEAWGWNYCDEDGIKFWIDYEFEN